MKKLLAVASFLFVMMFGLSACGGGAASTTIDVLFAEFIFTPSEFTVPAGQEITVNAINNGAVVHNFVIMKLGQTVGDSFDDEDQLNIYWEVEAEPGIKVAATFTAPAEPGEYQVVCRTEGHYIAGMIGKLIVVSAE